jgi:hypothetical protein
MMWPRRRAVGGTCRTPLISGGANAIGVEHSKRGELRFGIGAPKNTPAEIVDKLNKEINAALADPKIKARLADMGCAVIASSPVDLGASNQSILPRYVSPMEARNSSSLARINHSEQDVAPLRVRAIS